MSPRKRPAKHGIIGRSPKLLEALNSARRFARSCAPVLITGPTGSGKERVARYIDFLINDPLGVVMITRLASTPAVAAVEAKRWDALVTVGARNMAEGQRAGAVTAGENSELLAAMVLGAVRAAVTRAIAQGKTKQSSRLAGDIWAFARRGLQLD